MTPEPHDADAPARADALGIARILWIAAAGICLAVATAVGVHRSWVAPGKLRRAVAAQESVGLSTPAWIPSGRPLRLPARGPSGVDLRFAPGLPDVDRPLPADPGAAP